MQNAQRSSLEPVAVGRTISEEYRKLNAELHETRQDYGVGGHNYAELVTQIALSIRADSILDYGCGKNTLGNALPQFNVTPYDPAIPEYAETPDPHDLVVCTDVAEHIEPLYLESVLDDLAYLTKKVLIIVVATRPAKKTLSDGRNAHLIQEKSNWWLPRLQKRFQLDSFQNYNNTHFMAVLSNPEAGLKAGPV